MSRQPADLSRLNETEGRVLRLLAEGHTAKSIATELGVTPAAVNERLREARRKTGAGSSRELARLLKAQENQDKIIGVGSKRTAVASLPPADAEPWRPHTGVFAMIAFGLLAAAGAAALVFQQPAATNEVDPLLGPMPNSEYDPVKLHVRVRAEARDAVWAPRAEQVLVASYSRIAHVTGPNNRVRVICAATLCEVAGSIDAPFREGHEYDRDDPVNTAMRELQGTALHDELLKAGLDGQGGMFGAKLTFVQYYHRKDAAK